MGSGLDTMWFGKALREDRFEAWFQPIFDTQGDSNAHDVAMQAIATQPDRGPWFVNFEPSLICAREFHIPEFCQAGLSSRDIVFEAAECCLAEDPDRSRYLRDFMRNCGFGFAVDDAGTRPGSLRTVADLAPDYIKLDKSLVQSIERPLPAATIRKLVEIGDETGARVIAKGVDRTRIMENLWLLGVRYMQGYLFGSPKPGG